MNCIFIIDRCVPKKRNTDHRTITPKNLNICRRSSTIVINHKDPGPYEVEYFEL